MGATGMPRVGISTYLVKARWGPWDQLTALLPVGYVRAVQAAGGRPVLLPPMLEGVPETLEAIDALILCGGADLDPALYGQARDPATAYLASDRDRPELELARAALERDLPLLGICRGMQVLNVLRGGTLIQHLPDVGRAGHVDRPGAFVAHPVTTRPGSRVAGAIGERAEVMSGHHQGVGNVGAGLVQTAWTSDGTIEAIEDPERRFAVGVLWHPEQGADRGLFEALLGARA